MICVIPARGGSQRIPNKNIRNFHGKPIIAYSIQLAKDSGLFERIVVSTESVDIGAVALAYGAEVHERPPELAEDAIGTQEVVGAVLKDLGVAADTDVCALYATSPLLTLGDLCYGHLFLKEIPVACTYSDVLEKSEPSGGFYFAKCAFFLKGHDPYKYGVGVQTSDMDINTMEDWKQAEKLYEARHEND